METGKLAHGKIRPSSPLHSSLCGVHVLNQGSWLWIPIHSSSTSLSPDNLLYVSASRLFPPSMSTTLPPFSGLLYRNGLLWSEVNYEMVCRQAYHLAVKCSKQLLSKTTTHLSILERQCSCLHYIKQLVQRNNLPTKVFSYRPLSPRTDSSQRVSSNRATLWLSHTSQSSVYIYCCSWRLPKRRAAPYNALSLTIVLSLPSVSTMELIRDVIYALGWLLGSIRFLTLISMKIRAGSAWQNLLNAKYGRVSIQVRRVIIREHYKDHKRARIRKKLKTFQNYNEYQETGELYGKKSLRALSSSGTTCWNPEIPFNAHSQNKQHLDRSETDCCFNVSVTLFYFKYQNILASK